MPTEHLSTYLNDHLAGAKFALEILHHLNSEAPAWSTTFSELEKEIEQDRDLLKKLMAEQHIDESRARKAAGWFAEQLTEFKVAVDDDDRGSLRLLERLEALAIGIDGKIALWRALEAAMPGNSTLAGVNYDILVERGKSQRARVETLRLEAAREALIS